MGVAEDRQSTFKQLDAIASRLTEHDRELSDLIKADIRLHEELMAMVRGLEQRLPSDEDLVKLRELIKSEERTVWLWTTVKVWATWIAAVAVGVTVGWDVLKKIIASLR